jgi:type IV pilus assembly protein PilA
VKQVQKGLTFYELLFVVVIIGIFAAVAIPSLYCPYPPKARYTNVINATHPFKLAVELCVEDRLCNKAGEIIVPASGARSATGVPDDLTVATEAVNSITVSAAGIITATPVAANGIAATDTYTLTPTIDAETGRVTSWVSGGGCKKSAATGSSFC